MVVCVCVAAAVAVATTADVASSYTSTSTAAAAGPAAAAVATVASAASASASVCSVAGSMAGSGSLDGPTSAASVSPPTAGFWFWQVVVRRGHFGSRPTMIPSRPNHNCNLCLLPDLVSARLALTSVSLPREPRWEQHWWVCVHCHGRSPHWCCRHFCCLRQRLVSSCIRQRLVSSSCGPLDLAVEACMA